MRKRSVVISGGGTGGHLYPALVVGRKLLALEPGLGLTYVGTRRDVEQRIMAVHGVKFIPMRIEGLKSRGLKSLRALVILPLAFVHSLVLLIRIRPGLVIGVGGYSSGPIVLLASWFRIPTVILEQNARPGFTNRLLARWVSRAVVAFPSTLPAKERTAALDVLVFGGSQGSRFLNDRITAALPRLAGAKDRLRLTHQTGTNDLERVRTAYRASGFGQAEVAAYFPGMAGYFGRADLIVSRAGATTLAEIIAARRAALLVPFAGASEDHQSANARELEAAGAAEVLPEDKAAPETLAARILHYLDHPGGLEAMERNLARLQSPDPAGRIAELCLSLMKHPAKETES